MTTALVYFRVADYDVWRAGYERAAEADPEVRSYRIWRGQDDPNRVVLAEEFGSREIAEAAYASQTTLDAMASDGIEMSSVAIEYAEEVAAWAR